MPLITNSHILCQCFSVYTDFETVSTTAYSVQEIASVVGYDNPLYFSRLFHKLCGKSPREFRDQFKEEEKDVEGRKEKDGIEFGE